MTDTPTDDEYGPDIDDVDLETLRGAFVEAFNARDLDAVLELLSDDVETPDLSGDGGDAMAEELQSIWERSPAAVLTHATVDDAPAAMVWLPDDGGHLRRVGLMAFDGDQGRLTAIEMPDDDAALEQALAETPIGDPLEEELDWSEWDSGESSEDADRD